MILRNLIIGFLFILAGIPLLVYSIGRYKQDPNDSGGIIKMILSSIGMLIVGVIIVMLELFGK